MRSAGKAITCMDRLASCPFRNVRLDRSALGLSAFSKAFLIAETITFRVLYVVEQHATPMDLMYGFGDC